MPNIRLISKEATKTSRGILSKGWYLIDSIPSLVKGNTENAVEPLAEFIGSRIAYGISRGFAILYDAQNSYLFPDIKTYNFPLVSVCPKWETVSSVQFSKYVDAIEQKSVKDYRMWLLQHASPLLLYQVSMMLFIDALIGNQDRHLNNWDIITSTEEMSPYIDFGASCVAWNQKDWAKIGSNRSISPDIAKPFAKTHLEQLKIIKIFLNRDKQTLIIEDPNKILASVLQDCKWISEQFPVYYAAVVGYLTRRVRRICSSVDFISIL